MHRDEVLFANDAFYLAFAHGDLEAMNRLWADRDDVVCAHPGWAWLSGRDAVMDSWARILGNPDQPAVHVHAARTVAVADDVMLVICYETVGDTVMTAVNVFVSSSDGPRLVSHQAGPCGEPPDLPSRTAPRFDA